MNQFYIGNQRGNKMGIFQAQATPERIPQQDRPRDMVKMIHAATDRGNPVDEMEGGIRQLAATNLDADHYGKRNPRYEPQELILSNELIALIGKIDSDGAELRDRTDEVLRVQNDVKAVLQKYVLDLNCHVQRQMAIVDVFRDEIAGMKTRIVETLNAKPAPAPRPNGNGIAHANSETSDEEKPQEPASSEIVPVVASRSKAK